MPPWAVALSTPGPRPSGSVSAAPSGRATTLHALARATRQSGQAPTTDHHQCRICGLSGSYFPARMSTAAHAPNCPTLSSFRLPGATPNPACCCGVTPYSCRIPRLWATDSQQRDPGPSLRRGRTHCHAPHHPNAHVRTVRAAHARAARAARAAPSRVPLPRRRDTTATCDQARAHRHASKVRVWRARGVFGLRHPFKNTPEWSPVSDREC